MLCKDSANSMQTLWKSYANAVQKLCKSYAKAMQKPCKGYANTIREHATTTLGPIKIRTLGFSVFGLSN